MADDTQEIRRAVMEFLQPLMAELLMGCPPFIMGWFAARRIIRDGEHKGQVVVEIIFDRQSLRELSDRPEDLDWVISETRKQVTGLKVYIDSEDFRREIIESAKENPKNNA